VKRAAIAAEDQAALERMAQAVIPKGNGSLKPLIDEIRNQIEASRGGSPRAASPEA
jgi:hypothetical protein